VRQPTPFRDAATAPGIGPVPRNAQVEALRPVSAALLDPTRGVLAELAELPYSEAKRKLLALFDETYTRDLLRRSSGNMSEAARRAGLDRSNFRRLLKRRRDERP
jgi:DNA-binding NtrC family response regulator